MAADSSTQRYLRSVFQLNPVWKAESVIALRSRALKIARLDNKTEVEEGQGDVTVLREAAKTQIATIQSQFWKMPLDQLKRQLEGVDVKRLPDLTPVVRRLRTAAACRAEFPRLLQEKWMGRRLLDAFKAAVVLPPSEAGFVRERFLARITDKQQLKKIKNAVQRIESDYPVLYALERDWFETLKKFKILHYEVGDAYEGGGSGGIDFDFSALTWPVVIGLFIVLRVILRILASGN